MTNHHLSNHQHHPKKNFGEKISIHKPDSDEKSGNDRRKTQQQQRSNRNVVELSVVPMLVPELPSHVPTPKTIETNLEPWTNKIEDALGGIHHHIQTIFSSAGDDNNIHHQHNNSSGKNNYTNRGKPIKYSPSPNTPPESPLSTSRKSKVTLTMTTPTQSKTKWGPDFWNFQKNRNNSITLSPSSAEGLDESSSSNNNNNSSNNNTKTRGGIFSKRKSSKPKTKSPSNNSVDLATQEALMKDAMAQWKARKQQQQDTSTSTNNNTDKKTKTKATTGKTRSGDTSTATVPDDPSSSLLPPKRPYSPRSTVGNDVLAKKACDEAVGNGNGASNSSTQTNADADGGAGGSPPASRTGGAGISPRSIATTTKQKQPPTPLQMKWMLENALNLHAICHKDSFRI